METYRKAVQRARKAGGTCEEAFALHSWEEFFAHPQASEWAVWYASMVLHARWPEAEETIRQDPQAAADYAHNVLHARWPEAEGTIRQDPWAAAHYARMTESVN